MVKVKLPSDVSLCALKALPDTFFYWTRFRDFLLRRLKWHTRYIYKHKNLKISEPGSSKSREFFSIPLLKV